MTRMISRLSATAALAAIAWLLLAGATASKPSAGATPDKLVILSTNDVKGKASPCG